MLVMSGSDRDKLLRLLVNTNAAPFYGSQIQRMPELGADFVAHIAHLIARQRPDLGESIRSPWPRLLPFLASARNFLWKPWAVLSPLATHTGRFEDAMLAKAAEQQRSDEAQMESDYTALRPLEQGRAVAHAGAGHPVSPLRRRCLAVLRRQNGRQSHRGQGTKSPGGPARPPGQPGLEIRPQ